MHLQFGHWSLTVRRWPESQRQFRRRQQAEIRERIAERTWRALMWFRKRTGVA